MYNSFCDEISKRPSIWVERTTITKSATAAAGSGDLHAYRRFKRAETLRQREEEEVYQEILEHEEFQKTREDKFMKSQEITNKKHNKRVQEKLKLKIKKQAKNLEKKAVELNKFSNDGTFLETFLQKQQQQSYQNQETKEQKEECLQEKNQNQNKDENEEKEMQQQQNSDNDRESDQKNDE